VEHRKRYFAYVTFSALYHFHVDTKRIRKLPRQQRVILFKAIDEYLEGCDHAAHRLDDFAFGREFSLGIMTSVYRKSAKWLNHPTEANSITNYYYVYGLVRA